MILADIIGYAGAIVGTSVMLPQVYKSFVTKKVDDISFIMLSLYLLNCILWAIYGFLLWAMPVIICNLIALLTTLVQIGMKFKYGSKITQ